MQGLLEFAKTLGAPRIAAMAAVTLALVGFFAFLILRVTAPQMTPLFTDLSYDDSSAIVKELERQAAAAARTGRAKAAGKDASPKPVPEALGAATTYDANQREP